VCVCVFTSRWSARPRRLLAPGSAFALTMWQNAWAGDFKLLHSERHEHQALDVHVEEKGGRVRGGRNGMNIKKLLMFVEEKLWGK
jgi:hypothetical protein